MSSNIKKIKLKEILEITSSKRIFMSEYLDSGIPFYRSKEIIEKSKGNNISTELFISEDKFNEIKKKFGVPVAGDILLTSVGTLGIPYLVQEQDEFYFKDGNLTWFRYFSSDIDNKFMLCWLQSKNAKEQFDMITIGSTQKALTISSLKELEIPLPPLPTQKKIAHILSTLDDKIELNRKMNQTLEEMAQALFKSWFVDFDPVHAKAKCSSDEELETAACELGISKEILDLFPSEFEESELGMIPKGWEVKPLSSIAYYQNGLALQKFRPLDESNYLPVLKIAQLNKGYTDGEEKADVNIKPECIVDSGDIIFSWSGTLIVDIWCGGKAALNQHLFKVTSKDFPKWFYYYWTKQHLYWFQHIAASKAVTMGHIKRSHLDEALCCIPTEGVFAKAEDLIGRLVEKTISNRLEIQTLQKTRDTLLPKLLSGELDVSEFELDMKGN